MEEKTWISEFLWFQTLLAIKVSTILEYFLYPADVGQIKNNEFSDWSNSVFHSLSLIFLKKHRKKGVCGWGKIDLFIF